MRSSPLPAETRQGVLYAIACYGAWGLFPVFWKLVASVSPPEVLAHRIVWSLAFMLTVVAVRNGWSEVAAVLESRRRLLTLTASTLCISLNWLLFIWAVGQGRVLESSMGYFLNPLVNVLLGVAVLKERLRPLQWIAVALAVVGVAQMALFSAAPPWVAITLAVSFGTYGLLRKRLPMSPLTGLTVETGLLTPLAIAFLVWRGVGGSPPFGGSAGLAALLVLGGIVTALPLVWFAAAASRLRYSTLGFFQYLAPTGHFLLAVLVYGETLSRFHVIAFACIWIGIGLYLVDAWQGFRSVS
jgi:chloramphenicol-sensitive protein RarD